MGRKSTFAAPSVSSPLEAVSKQTSLRLVGVRLRPFGQRRSDLDVEFTPDSAPSTVTAILAACEEPPAADTRIDEIWNWQVSARIARLVEIAAITEKTNTINAVICCEAAKCRQAIEIEVPIPDLLKLRPDEKSVEMLECSFGQNVLQFRRPTGRDQQAWGAMSFPNASAAYAAMARTLLASGSQETQLDPAWLDELGEAFEEFDPLAAFRIACACPHCGHEGSLPLDLQRLCLQRLKDAQREVIRQVHALASAYGWTEEDVLGIPPWRRQQYLKWAGQETNR